MIMEKVFEAKQNLMKILAWSENPFVKDLRLENREDFIKYYYPLESAAILKKLAFDTKACILLGPKGVGKTSALYFVMYSLPQDEFITFLFKQPPESLDELAREIGIGDRGFFSQIKLMFSKKKAKGLSRAQIASRLREFDKKVVFFMDEAHLVSNKEMYMEFKYLLDELPNLRLVLCALGKDTFPDSLLQIVGEGNVFTRAKFNTAEMREIITHRIAAVGGRKLEPFDEEFLSKILTEQNLLTPRYVFDELNNYLADLALDEKRVSRLALKMKVMEEWEQTDAKRKAQAHVNGKPKVVASASKELEKPAVISTTEGKQNDDSKKGTSEIPNPEESDLAKKYAHDPLVASVIAEGKYKRVQEATEQDALGDEDEIIDGDVAANEATVERFVGEKHIAPVKLQRTGSTQQQQTKDSLSFLTTMHAEWWVQLSPSQQQIMGLLLSNSQNGFTLAQIMGKTGLSQNTAFNALYQLRGDDSAEIARKPEVPFPLITVKKQVVGNKKRNIYFANEKIRNLFTMT